MLEGRKWKDTGEGAVNKKKREERKITESESVEANKSTYHLGAFFTIIKVREGDIYHFIFLL